jgi:hypothetical protein
MVVALPPKQACARVFPSFELTQLAAFSGAFAMLVTLIFDQKAVAAASVGGPFDPDEDRLTGTRPAV